MNLQMKNLVMHNFLSYGHTELDLTDKHYCLVSGVNNNPKDNALSNGSGKSSWGSAICWALTGQTANGLSKNIKNINVAENSCYVKLVFSVDRHSYEITRYAAPKSDLAIVLDGKDVSGKGLRDSETVLAKHLPDLTGQLIGSIIILGQGLPYKFSANTPAGRKEILEKLSKSDFMIQDLKERISQRSNILRDDLRSIQDALLVLNTNIKNNEALHIKLTNKLQELECLRDFDAEITNLQGQIERLEMHNKNTQEELDQKNTQYAALTENLELINAQKSTDINNENLDYNTYLQEYLAKTAAITSEINALKLRIQELKNIKDVCPTCGQKLPNVIKPNTDTEENELKTLCESFNGMTQKHQGNEKLHQEELRKINIKYQEQMQILQRSLTDVKKEIADLHNSLRLNDIYELKNKLLQVQMEKDTYKKNLSDVKKEIEDSLKEKALLDAEILTKDAERLNTESHIKVVDQLNTLIKRDFRGYLLKDIIDYINLKAKEYSELVFGTRDLDFILDGNNINISYCAKDFANLSGGEKQRIDLIIQFAIRDMMSRYLGFSSNILILDEIFDNLDAAATANVLNLITTKLDDVESIFIISHHADELDLPVDTQLVVTKNEQGISDITYC